MRGLSPEEQGNLAVFIRHQVSFALIEPTETGLQKSIMDATASVRHFLQEHHIHDYLLQQQGPEHKVVVATNMYTVEKVLQSKASLYRPRTKKGDPRIWFSGLGQYAAPNDILAIVYFDAMLHVVNLTQLPIAELLAASLHNPLQELLHAIRNAESGIARELLAMLQKIAHVGPVPSVVYADTSVGRTLETVLGIAINSSKQPDYKGIELKAFRGNRTNRKNLFAQVPDWSLSNLKSSAAILDTFGYQRGRDYKLYCTVSATTRNSQGLSLRVDAEQLIEQSDNPTIGDVVVWSFEVLHKRLREKHRETFWIEATTTVVDGREYFHYTHVEHTKKPIVSQFNVLLQQGMITVDHLIKRGEDGKAVEKGPLFKIKQQGLHLLFPPSEKYILGA